MSWEEYRHLTPPQVAALRACYSRKEARVLFGGAGFGGKSYLERAFAVGHLLKLRAMGFTKQVVLFASGTYETLRDRHFSHFLHEYGHLGELVLSDKEYGRCFRFYDRQIGAIALRNVSDPRERRGAEYCAGVIDELTELTREEYGDLAYMVRPSVSKLDGLTLPWAPILAGTNPDGIGHTWCKALWRPLLPPEARLTPLPPPDDKLEPADYIYVQCLPSDNPQFDEARFWASVAHLPEHVQRARRYGTWDAPEGARWGWLTAEEHQFRLSERFRWGIPASWPRVLSVDWGKRVPYCALWTAFDPDRGDAYSYREDYRAGLTADEQAHRMMELTPEGERSQIVATFFDPSMWAKPPDPQGDAELSVAEIYRDYWAAHGFQIAAPRPGYNRSRVVAFSTLDKLLKRRNGFRDWYISSECVNLWKELTGATYDLRPGLATQSEDLDPRCADHAITASYYGLHTYIAERGWDKFDFMDEVDPLDPTSRMRAAQDAALDDTFAEMLRAIGVDVL